MARLPLIDPDAGEPDAVALLRRVAAERRRPFNVYRMLANSPQLFERVYSLSSYLWNESALEPRLSELVILRVAQLTRSEYEWSRHVGLARRVGVEEEKIGGLAGWRGTGTPFDPGERAALALTDEVCRDVEASAATVEAVRDFHGDQATLELVILIGFYGMVAGMLRSLAVDPEEGDVPVFGGAAAQEPTGSKPG
jgi:AhpD family alkylhydroperoxidase